MRFLSLFSGIGGIDLGLERAGMTCVGQVEIDPFCRLVLAKHWPDVPRWDDVKEFDPSGIPVELVAGGFPCQDISVAGKGAGIEGKKSGLWSEMHRVIALSRPRWVLVENVPALRNRGADRVLGDLESSGYACQAFVVGASDVGAPHRRKRAWIVGRLGYPTGPRQQTGGEPTEMGDEADPGLVQQSARPGGGDLAHPQRRGHLRPTGLQGSLDGPRRQVQAAGDQQAAMPERCRTVVHATGPGLEGHRAEPGEPQERESRHPGPSAIRWPARPGQPQFDWEQPRLVKFPLGTGATRVSGGLARFANRNGLRAAGNSVVPQVVEMIGRQILAANLAEVAEALDPWTCGQGG